MLNDELHHDFEEYPEEELHFVKHELVRLMKMNLDSDKMIRERVKVEMNKFIYKILQEVCIEMNKHPYAIIEYEMFEEAIYPYLHVKEINQEKKRILAHLDAIKSDCEVLSAYVKKTLKINDSRDEDDFIPLTGRVKAIKKISKKEDY
ncbi:MAG: hypothetical protein J6W71_00810 [Methanobrevibacter sp.]|nr:hypothetical protein [Methanobrevibacter sp.]